MAEDKDVVVKIDRIDDSEILKDFLAKIELELDLKPDEIKVREIPEKPSNKKSIEVKDVMISFEGIKEKDQSLIEEFQKNIENELGITPNSVNEKLE